MMKSKGSRPLSSLHFSVVATIALALVVNSFATSVAAEAPSFGRICTLEGANTGTNSSSLICTKGANGKLTWAHVRLGASTGTPARALTAAPGSIDFYQWRPEDKDLFNTIISKFEALNPGVHITQVILPSADYTNFGYTKIRSNPKAALFATFRGAQFTQFAKGDMMTDLNSQRYTKQNVIANGLIAGQYEGKQLGIPYQYLFNDPLYNTEIFAKEKWELPMTFTALLAWCKTAKSAGYVPIAWPGAFRPNAGQIFNSMLMNTAPDYQTLQDRIEALDTGKADLTSDWFTEMAGKYKKMADAGCFPDNATGVTDAATINLFATGKSPVLPTGSFSMTAVKAINPAMSGKMQLMSLITTDEKPQYVGIHNNTFILSVNKNSTMRDQRIANAFLSFLVTGPIASIYANGSNQHLNVINVKYTNIDLINTSIWQGKRTLLAPRFLWLNQGVRDLTEDALIAIAGGKPVDATLADFSKQIKQKLN